MTNPKPVTIDMKDLNATIDKLDQSLNVDVDTKQLPTTAPVLKDSKGKVVPLEISSINTIGSETGKVIGTLNDEVLKKVKGSDNQIMGDGINKILSLTNSVDLTKLGQQPQSGITGWIRSKFTDTKLKVLSEFQTVADQVIAIKNSLDEGVERMRNETKWLESAYTANLEYYYELKELHSTVKEVFEYHENELKSMIDDTSIETHVIEDKKALVNALHKQSDKLLRIMTLSQLTAPQIRSMQTVNYNTIDKFMTLSDTVIPAWKGGLSLALISEKQRSDNVLAERIDEQTNRLFVDAAKLVGQNVVQAAKNSQRGVVEFETLEIMQNEMLTSLKEASEIEFEGRKQRFEVEDKLTNMAQQLENELRTYKN